MSERIDVTGFAFGPDFGDGPEQFYIHGNRENCNEQILVHFPASVAREMADFIKPKPSPTPKPTKEKN